ncbi:BCCT family transporter [Suttonella ornithocola]|uniref:Glycine betaine transporter BetP n=1 Tax=Suttonella ornithocola TaxID=279832 RepID=A0A380MX00_9GAMM|nr:BCCT family transporter [Suttonella ornithocola]SUO97130.1 Glycine betaine transporter BetP [Suttonella ornithocola]
MKNRIVILPALCVTAALVLAATIAPTDTANILSQLLKGTTANFGWFYMLTVAFMLITLISVAFSPVGQIRLGPDHAQPDYAFGEWFAMLFALGCGVGLVFFGVAEPVLHYANPPEGTPQTLDAAKAAMQIAYFHWGFHIWAVYGLTALVIAYFSFRHGLPFSLRSPFFLFFGKRVLGNFGAPLDIIAILCTLFGISTSLGLAAEQINAGLHYLFPIIPKTLLIQLAIIAFGSLSAVTVLSFGINRGMKTLSTWVVRIAFTLLILVFILGPSRFILEAFLENTGNYLNSIIARSFSLQAYTGGDWIGNWTIFFYAWTLAWAPFVGMFIAKISRGRTIREFITAVIIIPSILNFFWFSTFGDTAFYQILQQNHSELLVQILRDKATGIFAMFKYLPATMILSGLALIMLIAGVITGNASAALSIDTITANGKQNKGYVKLFWAIICGLLTAALLAVGGLTALQAVTVLIALPSAIMLVSAAIALIRALIIERIKQTSMNKPLPESQTEGKYTTRIENLIEPPNGAAVEQFIQTTAYNAMKRIADILNRQEWPCIVEYDAHHRRAFLQVRHKDLIDFHYGIRFRAYDLPEFSHLGRRIRTRKRMPGKYATAEVFLRQGGQNYNLYGFTEEDIMDDILRQFDRELDFIERVAQGSYLGARQ